MKMGFAAPVSGSWATPENQMEIARRAEDLGYHSLWTFQRLLFPASPDSPRWKDAYRSVSDPLVTLAYLAGRTSTIRLGVALLNMPFFTPTLLAKQLATLDIVSAGRLDVGLGLGWSAEEYAATRASFARRGERAEEFLRALRAHWVDDVVDFHGDFFEVPAARMDPKPVQSPHPPLLLGGGAAPALRRAGRLTDGWMSGSGADLTRIGESIARVKEAAADAGRDPGSLRFVCRGVVHLGAGDATGRAPLRGSVSEVGADMRYLREQGVTEIFLDPNFDPEIGSPDAEPDESLRRAREQMEAFAPG